MNQSTSFPARLRLTIPRAIWARVLICIAAICIAAIAVWGVRNLVSYHLAQNQVAIEKHEMESIPEPAAATPSAIEGIVNLPPAKQRSAAIEVHEVQLRSLPSVSTVPGRIGYDPAQRLEMKSPFAGVVVATQAAPGQSVRSGEPLARIFSSEVGIARSEFAHQAAQVELAERESQWRQQADQHLQELLTTLRARPSLESLEEQFSEKPLGTHRGTVLAAYSKLLLAEMMAARSSELAEQGTLSARDLHQRRSDREVAAAMFQSACEQARFDSVQERAAARADLEQSRRMLSVGRERLQSLLGRTEQPAPIAGSNSTSGDLNSDKLCEWTLAAPMAGVIEHRYVVSASHLIAGQPMFVLVNTDSLWISAEIYERNYHALSIAAGQEVQIRCPAMPEVQATARVRFSGVSVSTETRSVPLILELDNSSGKFKPGMFAWVTVPLADARSVLAVPASAVMRHEQQPFVFIERERGAYQRTDVTLGTQTPEWIEIRTGLTAGQRVVDRGAFFLKSELLLEREE